MNKITFRGYVFTIDEAREFQSELFYKISHYEVWLKDERRSEREKEITREKLRKAREDYEELTKEIERYDAEIIDDYLKFQPVYQAIMPVILEKVEGGSKTADYFVRLSRINREEKIEEIADGVATVLANEIVAKGVKYTLSNGELDKERIEKLATKILIEEGIIKPYDGIQRKQIEQYLEDENIELNSLVNITELAREMHKSGRVEGTVGSIRTVLNEIKNSEKNDK